MKIALTLFASALGLNLMAQKAPENWFNNDRATDKQFGVSSEKAYKELLKGKTSTTVVVAVLDSGVDTEHEDLKSRIWVNADEIPNNGIDDDKNGYVDDVNGWSFLGGANGRNVGSETLEMTRLYRELAPRFDGKDEAKISSKDKKAFDLYKKVKKAYEEEYEGASPQFEGYKKFKAKYDEAAAVVMNALGKTEYTAEEVTGLSEQDEKVKKAKSVVAGAMTNFGAKNSGDVNKRFEKVMEYFGSKLDHHLNTSFDPRWMVGDNPKNSKEKHYGNNDVKGPDAFHGTHVAGIIGADRNNSKGIKGVCENVKIMSVRCVPDGDERDKDVANAIRYAVDNGAHIINMSFGKNFAYDKKAVDAALLYASKKGVLLVHAAGNDNLNWDDNDVFPTPGIGEGAKAPGVPTFINVGASSHKDGDEFTAEFSNYSKTWVDIFAPGVNIYSTVPGSEYGDASGTSMAAPTVAGVAALVKSYYPNLSAVQIKDVLLKSSIKPEFKALKPGAEEAVSLSELCRTGGVVNAYSALKMAEEMSMKK